MLNVFLNLTNNVVVLFALVFLYSSVKQYVLLSDLLPRTLVTGFVFGIFAVIAMLNPIDLGDGVLSDARLVMVLAAAVLLGWRGAIVAAILPMLYRASQGGAGALAGVLSLMTPVVMAPFYHYSKRHFSIPIAPACISFAVAATLVNVSLAYILIPAGMAAVFVWRVGLPLLVMHPGGLLLVLLLLNREDQRLQMQATLEESERRFHAIFDQTFQFVGLLKPDGTVLEANSTALKFGGFGLEAIADRPFWEAYWWRRTPETQQQLQQAIQQAADGEFVRYNVEVQGAGERVITIDFSLKPIFDAVGNVSMLIPEGRDITDQLLAQQRALELEIEREKNRLMEDFIRETSHHLRTPIAVLKSSLYLCRRKTELVEEGDILVTDAWKQEMLGRLDKLDVATNDLEVIVEEMLELSTLSHAENYQFEQTQLHVLAEEAADMLEPIAMRKGIHLEVTVEPTTARVDAPSLRRVLENLIKNAVEYTERGGTVTVKTHMQGERAVIAVVDGGMGIALEELPHIFDQFYRSDAAQMARSGGTGLGLTIVKRVVDMHNGEILVNSTPGEGTCFTLRLPA